MDIADFFKDLDKQALYDEIHRITEQAVEDLEEKGYSGDTLVQETALAGSLAGLEFVLTQYHEWLVSQLADGTFLPKQ